MMRLFPLLLLVVVTSTLSAQTLFSRVNEDVARKMADTLGTFILIDFYSSGNFNCRMMNERVWELDTVQAVQDRFINIRVSGSTNNIVRRAYGISGVPALVVVDANGNEYFRNIGYLNHSQILELLNSFPTEMKSIYAVDKVARERPEDFEAQLAHGRQYQRKARAAKGIIADRFASISTESLEAALDILDRQNSADPVLAERLELMIAENWLIKERTRKALKVIADLGNTFEACNLALAYYIKGMVYRKRRLPELAEEYFELLRKAEDNEEFLALYQQKK